MSAHQHTDSDRLTPDQIASFRREGYVVVRQLIGPRLRAACIDALDGLASGRIPARTTDIALEPGVDPAGVTPHTRVNFIRKFAGFVEDAPALHAASMSARLHRMLDQLMGQGRVLLQDMALVKPPGIGGAKPWHQDASYFRVSDPHLITGVWIALDRATRDNGCMEVVPRSHLAGPVPHVAAEDVNQCTVRPDRLHAADRLQIELEPGDALIFHPLLHHYTAPNRSALRRWALQFHYHQTGMEWTDLEAHRQQYHDETGGYAGCTVPKSALESGRQTPWPDGRKMAVVPVDDWY
jgi:phytanoyl-CoA hydroxylase